MAGDWFAELTEAARHLLSALPNTFYLVCSWAREWQPLIAGLLVILAALIFARASLKAARIRAAGLQQLGSDASSKPQSDLRLASRSFEGSVPATSDELIGNLERLRSLIRSTLASLAVIGEKESGSSHLLCKRIAQVQLERSALPSNVTKNVRELHTVLHKQLSSFCLILNKDGPKAEVSEALVKLNSAARNLASALSGSEERHAEK
jgi:hypothetical protein